MTALDPVDVFSTTLVLGALVLATRVVSAEFRRANEEIGYISDHCDRLVATIRTAARECLRLKRAIAAQERTERRLMQECDDLEEAIAAIRRSAAPLVVLDERKSLGDALWQVPVGRAPRPGAPAAATAGPWRTVLVWAPNAERARQRVLLRYGEGAGYAVGLPIERPDFPESAV